MAITDQAIDQAYSDLKGSCGGVRNDYFGLLYLEQEFGLDREIAIPQVAFGGNDYGIDGFHFDGVKRNLYLMQFKYSESPAQFKESFVRLTGYGMERIFGAQDQDQRLNQLLLQIKSCLAENEAVIDRVCVHFVFMGDTAEAEKSKLLESLREDLENKKKFDRSAFGPVSHHGYRVSVGKNEEGRSDSALEEDPHVSYPPRWCGNSPWAAGRTNDCRIR